MESYFTSDLHFGHYNITKYCPLTRGHFSTTDEMNEEIIKNCNDVVGPDDNLYILGDVSMHNPSLAIKMLKRMNGKKFLVLGNHDKVKGKKEALQEFYDCFEWVEEYKEIYVQDLSIPSGKKRQKIIMSHYAFRVWNGQVRGTWMLYGHSHGALPALTNNSMDVGMDTRKEFKPYSYNEIKNIFKDHSIDCEDIRER